MLFSCIMQRNDENMFGSDKAMALVRQDHEEMGKKLNDHSKKPVKQFLRIEGKTTCFELVWFLLDICMHYACGKRSPPRQSDKVRC